MKAVVFGLALVASQNTFAQGLKDAYKDYFKVGVALNTRNFSEAEQKVILENYNSVTCENDMKPGELLIASLTGAVATRSQCVVTVSFGTASLLTGCFATRRVTS